jgi:hypothetical protein
MPDGDYKVGVLVVGGDSVERMNLRQFDRQGHVARVGAVEYRGRSTPLDDAFTAAGEDLSEVGGRTAIIIFSDGIPTRYGKEIGPDSTVASVVALAEARTDPLCIHTIQIGNDDRGTLLMRELSEITGCGCYRLGSAYTTGASISAAQRAVFLRFACTSSGGRCWPTRRRS